MNSSHSNVVGNGNDTLVQFRSEVIKTADSTASGRNKKGGKGGHHRKGGKNKKVMDLAELAGPYPIVSPGKRYCTYTHTWLNFVAIDWAQIMISAQKIKISFLILIFY